MVELIDKLRSLLGDRAKKDTRAFVYESRAIFELDEENVNSILQVLKNDNGLESGEDYTFNIETNEITINACLNKGDVIIIKYNYFKYNAEELENYIINAISWINILGACSVDFQIISGNNLYPAPSNKEADFICLVAMMLAKPEYLEYRTPDLTVKYPRTKSVEQKITDLCNQYLAGTLGYFFAE